MYTFGSQSRMLEVLHFGSPPQCLETGSLMELEACCFLSKLVSSKLLRSSYHCPLVLGLQVHMTFYRGSGDSNACPHEHRTSGLTH